MSLRGLPALAVPRSACSPATSEGTIISSSGIKFFDSKLEAYNLGKSLIENENSNIKPEYLNKVIEDIKKFELGFDSGRDDIFAWEADANYVPHLLLDYLKSEDIS